MLDHRTVLGRVASLAAILWMVLDAVWPGEVALALHIESPIDFAVGPDGRICVLEASREKGFARVRVLTQDGKLLRSVGKREEKPTVKTDGLLEPTAVDVGKDGSLFVATKLWGSVSVNAFDTMGAPYLADGEGFKGAVKEFSSRGDLVRVHEFRTCPFDVVVRGGTLYVGESYGTWSYDCATGKEGTNWAGQASKAFGVGPPGALLLFKFGTVVVVDDAGAKQAEVPLQSPQPLKKASALVAGTDSILVASPENQCIYQFRADGTLQATLAKGRAVTKLCKRDDILYALDSDRGEILRVTAD